MHTTSMRTCQVSRVHVDEIFATSPAVLSTCWKARSFVTRWCASEVASSRGICVPSTHLWLLSCYTLVASPLSHNVHDDIVGLEVFFSLWRDSIGHADDDVTFVSNLNVSCQSTHFLLSGGTKCVLDCEKEICCASRSHDDSAHWSDDRGCTAWCVMSNQGCKAFTVCLKFPTNFFKGCPSPAQERYLGI